MTDSYKDIGTWPGRHFSIMIQQLYPRHMMRIVIVLSVLAISICTLILTIFPAPTIKHTYSHIDESADAPSTFKKSTPNLTRTEERTKTCEMNRLKKSNSTSDKAQLRGFPILSTIHIKEEKSSRPYLSPEDLFFNISKMKVDNSSLTYYRIKEEGYLKQNISFFKTRNETINNFDFSFLIEGDMVCQKEAPFLIIIIPSVVTHRDRRDAIRRTWLAASENKSWPRVHIRQKIKHVFIFGYRMNSKRKDLHNLLQESYIYNDVVMLDFLDTYRNLTIKMLSALRWTHQFCDQAEYLLKVDEDTFINAPLLIELLMRVQVPAGNKGFVLGHRHHDNRPYVVRRAGDRWEVDTREYPFSYYPRYLLGHSYAVSRVAVGLILHASRTLNLVSPEDAFITGIAAKSAGVARMTAPSFATCCARASDCNIVWNRKVSMTTSSNAKTIDKIWTNIQKQYCNYDDTEN